MNATCRKNAGSRQRKEKIMEIRYIESDIGKKKLRKAKRTYKVFLISIILITVTYCLMALDANNFKGLIVFTAIYAATALIARLITEKHMARVVTDTLAKEICLDGFINLHIYNAEKAQKRLKNPRARKSYDYSLINLVDGYARKGDFEQANALIAVLEKEQLDCTQQALLIKYKAMMAFYAGSREDLDAQLETFQKLESTLPRKVRESVMTSLMLQKYVLENNADQANGICDRLMQSKLLMNKVVGHYYKGLLLEQNGDKTYEQHYRYVVEHGNDLHIAKLAALKLGIPQRIQYRTKKYIGFKIFVSFFLAILTAFTAFTAAFYAEDAKPKKWDTGIVHLLNRKVELPCTVPEFEQAVGIKLGSDARTTDGFYEMFLHDGDVDYELYVDGGGYGNMTLTRGMNIELLIEDGMITGVMSTISPWSEEPDAELGKIVEFPEGITVYSDIKQIHKAYRTGWINPAMRDWHEKIENSLSEETIYSYGCTYSGDDYDIAVHCRNGVVESIFYYYEGAN